MEDRQKNVVKIIVAVICILIAAFVLFKTFFGGGGLESVQGETWMKCVNPDCEAEFQISEKEYINFVNENIDPEAETIPPMQCPQCNEKSAYRATKCEKCGTVFIQRPQPDGFSDRCPNCGYSKIEDLYKQSKEN